MTTIRIIREISKLIIIVTLWVIPIFLFKISGNPRYLLIMLASFIAMLFVNLHYEDLERINSKDDKDEEA